MNLILHIDTAVQSASVCLSDGATIVASRVNPSEKESASWLHPAISDILVQNGFVVTDLQAIAISTGPGSYTGLRVGMAAAKGLCYSLSIPLIQINTLQMMAAGVREKAVSDLLCPMIDARRMEVFTALYDVSLNTVLSPTNMILDDHSFADWLQHHTVTFFGNGSNKWRPPAQLLHAFFVDYTATATDMVSLAVKKFEAGQFLALAYSEPEYGKDFHSSVSKKFY